MVTPFKFGPPGDQDMYAAVSGPARTPSEFGDDVNCAELTPNTLPLPGWDDQGEGTLVLLSKSTHW